MSVIGYPSDGGVFDFDINEAQQLLTQRQLQVSILVGMGLSNKQIARKLDIEEETVKDHVRGARSRTHAKDRAELVCRLFVSGVFKVMSLSWLALAPVVMQLNTDTDVEIARKVRGGRKSSQRMSRRGRRLMGFEFIEDTTELDLGEDAIV